MNLNQRQIEAIRNLVNAVHALNPETTEVDCGETLTDEAGNEYPCEGQQCVHNVITDDGELINLRYAVEFVERDILDRCPTLPTEIETAETVARLERELLSL